MWRYRLLEVGALTAVLYLTNLQEDAFASCATLFMSAGQGLADTCTILQVQIEE